MSRIVRTSLVVGLLLVGAGGPAIADTTSTGGSPRNIIVMVEGTSSDLARTPLGPTALSAEKTLGLVTDGSLDGAVPAGFLGQNGGPTEMIDGGATVVMGAGPLSVADRERLAGGDTDFEFVETGEQFAQLAAGGDLPRRVFGVPLSTVADPSLAVMTSGALNVIGRNEKGLVLLVEGGNPVAFDEAVDLVQRWVEVHSSWEDTLLVLEEGAGSISAQGAGAEDVEAAGPQGQVVQLLQRYAAVSPSANLSWIWPVGIAVVVLGVMAGGAVLRTRRSREI